MTGAERTAIAGSSPAVNCFSRWGDYSDMTLDPTDNLTFWHVNQYDKSGSAANRIFSFKISGGVGFNNPIDLAEFKVYQQGNYLNTIAAKLPSNDMVEVDLLDISGKQVSSHMVWPEGNAIKYEIPVSGLAREFIS